MSNTNFTIEEIIEASENCGGFCINCGAEAWNIEPDARKYHCDSCGEDEVYGAEEIAIMGLAF